MIFILFLSAIHILNTLDAMFEIAKNMHIKLVMLIDTEGVIHMNPAMQSRIRFEPDVTVEIRLSEPLS